MAVDSDASPCGTPGFAIAERGAWLAGITDTDDRGGVDEAGVATPVVTTAGA